MTGILVRTAEIVRLRKMQAIPPERRRAALLDLIARAHRRAER